MRTPHSDEPTLEDLLGHERLAQNVARRLRAVPTPYALGVHGDWGMGKSSLLLKLEHELRKPQATPGAPDKGLGVMRFEAWKHQFEEQPVVGLLHAIRAAFVTERKLWNNTKKLLSVATYGALSVIGDLSAALSAGTVPKGLATTMRQEGERYEREAFAVPLQSEAVQQLYAGAVKELLGKRERLVVIIDDLDRCADTSIVRLLESIKLYLNAERCVYVVAADREAVVRAVQRGLFGGDPDKGDDPSRRTRERAEGYVEKLFQAVEHLPVVPPVAALAQKLCDGWSCKGEALQAVLGQYGAILPGNPRRVKRLVSELGARADDWESRYGALGDEDWRVLFAVQCLATFHPTLYRRLEADPAFWDRLVAYTKSPQRDEPEPFNALKLPDALSGERWVSAHHDPGAMSVLLVAPLLRDLELVPHERLQRALRQAPAVH